MVLVFSTRQCGVEMRLVPSVRVSLPNALTSDSLDIKSSVLVCGYVFKILSK